MEARHFKAHRVRERNLRVELFEVTILLSMALLRVLGVSRVRVGGTEMAAWEESPSTASKSLQLSSGHGDERSCRSEGRTGMHQSDSERQPHP